MSVYEGVSEMSAGGGANGRAPDAPEIPISPVPLTLTVGQVMVAGGKQLVILRVTSPMGTQVFFLDADCAIATGQHLRQAGKASRTGLIIPASL